MYSVSEKFRNAIKRNTRKYYWSGTITTTKGKVYAISPSNIIKGSGYIKRQCCSGSEIELGTVYSAEMGISLLLDVDRYTLTDAIVKLYYNLEISDGTVESIPMGIFEVSEANRNIKTLELKGYDYMLRFEKTLKLEASSGTPYQFIKACCDACKVEMAQTVAEINDMPNGKTTFGIYSDNDIETFRDLLFYIAQAIGGYCQINREGKLEIKHFHSTPVLTIPQTERFDSSYSDFVTSYTAVSSTNQIKQTSEYIAMETDDALTMNLGINPLLQFGLKATREKILRNILTSLQQVQYVPFDSTTIGNPALDPGDILRFSGGHADETTISCITDIEYKIGGKMSLKCVGKNPRLSGAKSKNEKNIQGLLNTVESGKTIIYSFVNVAPFDIGSSFQNVMDIDFTATEDTTAAFQCEMLLEVVKPDTLETDDLPELTIQYRLNNDIVDGFLPTKACVYGKHIVTLFFPLSKVIENSSNTFSMYLKMTGAKATIGEAQIRATISGQGLAAGLGDWNGRININETISMVPIDGAFLVDTVRDSMTVVFPSRKTPGISQTISNIAISNLDFTIDTFTDRTWIAEILRTYVLTSVRGYPKYNGYVTVNSDEAFTLLKSHQINSRPISMNRGYVEKLVTDTTFLESLDALVYTQFTPWNRGKYTVNTKNVEMILQDGIGIENGCFELMDIVRVQTSEEDEIDTGYLYGVTPDFSDFDGVKGVEIRLWITTT